MYIATSSGEILMTAASDLVSVKKRKPRQIEIYQNFKILSWMYIETSSGEILMIATSWFL